MSWSIACRSKLELAIQKNKITGLGLLIRRFVSVPLVWVDDGETILCSMLQFCCLLYSSLFQLVARAPVTILSCGSVSVGIRAFVVLTRLTGVAPVGFLRVCLESSRVLHCR
jgi:hypothetical protein